VLIKYAMEASTIHDNTSKNFVDRCFNTLYDWDKRSISTNEHISSLDDLSAIIVKELDTCQYPPYIKRISINGCEVKDFMDSNNDTCVRSLFIRQLGGGIENAYYYHHEVFKLIEQRFAIDPEYKYICMYYRALAMYIVYKAFIDRDPDGNYYDADPALSRAVHALVIDNNDVKNQSILQTNITYLQRLVEVVGNYNDQALTQYINPRVRIEVSDLIYNGERYKWFRDYLRTEHHNMHWLNYIFKYRPIWIAMMKSYTLQPQTVKSLLATIWEIYETEQRSAYAPDMPKGLAIQNTLSYNAGKIDREIFEKPYADIVNDIMQRIKLSKDREGSLRKVYAQIIEDNTPEEALCDLDEITKAIEQALYLLPKLRLSSMSID
jgi:hypothetical protein